MELTNLAPGMYCTIGGEFCPRLYKIIAAPLPLVVLECFWPEERTGNSRILVSIEQARIQTLREKDALWIKDLMRVGEACSKKSSGIEL